MKKLINSKTHQLIISTLKPMKFPLFTLCGAAACLLASCGSIQTLTFDQLYPASLTYPEQVTRVAVVNNVPPVPSSGEKKLTLGVLEGDGKIAAETLAASLADSRYFNQVLICDSALRVPGEPLYGDHRLTLAQVDTLSALLGADMLFSVERVRLQTSRQEVFYPGFPMPLTMVEIKATPLVRIYIPSRETPVATLAKTDSLYWELSPSLTDAQVLKEGTAGAFSVLQNDLVPHWEPATRMYYDGGSVEMRDAAVCLRENDWQGARDLWTKLYDARKKGSQKMKAAFNIALSWEMEGDLKQAKEWIDKAQACAPSDAGTRDMLQYYARLLEEKTKNQPKLDLQMRRFENKIP